MTVIGCPALEQLGGDAATGGSLDFPNKAKASFLYSGDTGSEISEELYSDSAPKLAAGTKRIFDAMTGCPVYQVVVGSKLIKVTTQKLAAPALGDQAWSQLLTFTAGGQDSVVKQTAVRTGGVLLILSYAGPDMSLLRSRCAEERDWSAGVAGFLHPSWSAAAEDRMRLAA